MAEKIELVELDWDVDAAISSGAKLEKRIIGLKSEMKDLKKDFNDGKVSVEEYSKQHTKLDSELKTVQKNHRSSIKAVQAYTDSQDKSTQAIKTSGGSINQLGAILQKNRNRYRDLTEEQRENEAVGGKLLKVIEEQDEEYKRLQGTIGSGVLTVKEYKSSIGETVEEQNLWGVSLGGLKDKIISFVNPVTAGVGALAALGKMYLSSTNGAKDFQRAQSQLNIAMSRFNNSLARAVGADADGNGLLSSFIDAFNTKVFGLAEAAIARLGADAQIELEKLEVAQIEADKRTKDQLKQAEELRQIRDDERKSFEERNQANLKLLEVINQRQEESVAFLQKRLDAANLLNVANENSLETQKLVKQIELEIADIKEESAGFISEQEANDLALFKERNQEIRDLSIAQIEERLIKVEQGSIEELKLLLEKNEAIKQIEIEAAGENANLRATAIQNARNNELQIEKDFYTAREEHRKLEEEKELQNELAFNEKKRELKNQIELNNAENDEERELLKVQQEFEKQQLELEKLQLDEEQKMELLIMLEEQRGQAIESIRDKFNKIFSDQQKKAFDKNLKAASANAQAEAAIQRELVGILQGLLGDSLGAQLAGIASEALLKSGEVKVATAAASARNLAQATAALPPPANLPLIKAAIEQNIALKANATKQIAQISAAAAISGSKAIITKGFATGGLIGNDNMSIPTQPNGDNVLITAKRGEAVLNENQIAALGGARTFASIGVPGFATGGLIGSNGGSNNSQGLNIDELASKLAEANRSLPNPIVTVEDINAGQENVAIVESQANI
ncbi:hypothetical protein [Ekhidna sp.]